MYGGMTKPIGRPSTWDQYADEMVRLYEDEKKSRGEIARQYGTSVQTITRVLSRHGVLFEDRQGNANVSRTSEEQARINAKISASKTGVSLPKKEREARTCLECTAEFVYRPGRSGEHLCSRSCRNKYNARVNKQTAMQVYADDPRRCPCGEAIPFEHRHNRMFCSPEHRKEYGAKRQADPVNHVTFDCLNCGKEVTRYRNYGNGHNKYCSNACAAKHTKVKKHYAIEGLEIVFDSSYECLFYGLCMLHKIPIERFDRSQCIPFGEDGWYGPDFVVQTRVSGFSPVYVEIKGHEDEDDVRRCDAWRAQGHQLAMITQERMIRLLTGDPHELRRMINGYAEYGENVRLAKSL